MSFTAQDVAKLRQQTGVGMMECKKALTDANGDFEKAIVLLRERGLKAVDKKQGRIASEGLVASYIHMGGKIGVLVEVNCETDFVAKSADFQNLVKDIAMQIAAANPKYVSEAEVDPQELENEKEILRVQALNEGKPANIVERMIEGRIKKYYEDQGYICEIILSQNSPSSIILFTEDKEKNERYIEIKFIVKKPEYEPDDDIEDFKAEIEKRAVKQVKADINKLPKKERLAAEQQANKKVKEIIESYE